MEKIIQYLMSYYWNEAWLYIKLKSFETNCGDVFFAILWSLEHFVDIVIAKSIRLNIITSANRW